jgi:hypothetical protein
MISSLTTIELRCARRAAITSCMMVFIVAAAEPVRAAGCAFEPQGEGRVAAVIDARSFRLDDGREVRLAGIEAVASEQADRTAALSAIVTGHEVTLS